MKDSDPNKGNVEFQLVGMLSEIDSVRRNKIQTDMIQPLVAGKDPLDQKTVEQLNGFLNDMTKGVQENANKFLDGVYLSAALPTELITLCYKN